MANKNKSKEYKKLDPDEIAKYARVGDYVINRETFKNTEWKVERGFTGKVTEVIDAGRKAVVAFKRAPPVHVDPLDVCIRGHTLLWNLNRGPPYQCNAPLKAYNPTYWKGIKVVYQGPIIFPEEAVVIPEGPQGIIAQRTKDAQYNVVWGLFPGSKLETRWEEGIDPCVLKGFRQKVYWFEPCKLTLVRLNRIDFQSIYDSCKRDAP